MNQRIKSTSFNKIELFLEKEKKEGIVHTDTESGSKIANFYGKTEDSLLKTKKGHKLVRKGTLPAHTTGRPSERIRADYPEKILRFSEKQKKYKGQEVSHQMIQTWDSVKIETLSIQTSDQQNLKPKDQKWVVCFNPNNGHFQENLRFLGKYAEEAGVNILAVNYRGTGNSEGAPHQFSDLVSDGAAAIDYLESQGVKGENIACYGHSIGGSVAANVAGVFADDKVNYIGDRTFEKLSKVAKNFLSGLGSKSVKSTNWESDTYGAFKKIKGKKVVIGHHQDLVINYRKSSLLHKVHEDLGLTEPSKKDRELQKSGPKVRSLNENEEDFLTDDDKTKLEENKIRLIHLDAYGKPKSKKDKKASDAALNILQTGGRKKRLEEKMDFHNYTYDQTGHRDEMKALAKETAWALNMED